MEMKGSISYVSTSPTCTRYEEEQRRSSPAKPDRLKLVSSVSLLLCTDEVEGTEEGGSALRV